MPNAAVRQLIVDRYAAVHGAAPPAEYPDYLTVKGPDGPYATLGYRRAGSSRLFLEQYLDSPIEQVLSERLGRPIARETVVELGDHASRRPAATVTLWLRTADALCGRADFAVAVLTAPLRAMLRRLDLTLLELAPATASRLGDHAANWGRYYATDPVLCAGHVPTNRTTLTQSARNWRHGA